ncbi:MAG: hypothetical protein RIB59_16240 [Rhodospirillales bacterium]
MSIRNKGKFFNIGIAALMICAVGASSPAQAVDFSGKKIEIILPFKEGGGTSVYGRLFEPFMKKSLPGNPAIIIQHVPGGGTIRGNNRFEAQAKPDGLTLAGVSTSSMVAALFGGKKVRYNMLKWRPVIVSPLGTIIYVRSDTGFTGKDIAADTKLLRGMELKFGAKSPIAGELRASITYDLLGLNVKTVFGLERGEARKATMRGELPLGYDSGGSYVKSVSRYVKKGVVKPYYTLGYLKGGKVVRDPAFPDVPTFPEVYEKTNGKKPSGPGWDAWKSFLNMGVMASKGFSLPKGTPDAIVNVYIDAFKRIMADEAFQKKAASTLGAYPQSFGADAAEIYKNALDLSSEAKTWLKTWIETNFQTNVTIN